MFIDEGEMDDYERLMYDGLVIYQDLHGADESEAITSKRFKFCAQLQLSAPHHCQKLETWVEGNVYQFIKLVTTNVRLTGRARFNTIAALGALRFGADMSVDDLINKLHQIKTAANRLQANSMDDDLLRGAFLTLCGARDEFHRLSEDFSKRTCTLTYQEIIDEMRECESNRGGNTRVKHHALHAEASRTDERLRTYTGTEIAALFKTFSSSSSSSSSKDGGAAEVCRNYLAGKCTYEKCKRQHPVGKAGSKTRGGGSKEKRKMRCFNCQQMSTHLAADCTNPRVERPVQAQANSAMVDDTTRSTNEITMEDFLQSLVNPQSASMMVTTVRLPSADSEDAALMVGATRKSDVTGDGPTVNEPASSTGPAGSTGSRELDRARAVRSVQRSAERKDRIQQDQHAGPVLSCKGRRRSTDTSRHSYDHRRSGFIKARRNLAKEPTFEPAAGPTSRESCAQIANAQSHSPSKVRTIVSLTAPNVVGLTAPNDAAIESRRFSNLQEIFLGVHTIVDLTDRGDDLQLTESPRPIIGDCPSNSAFQPGTTGAEHLELEPLNAEAPHGDPSSLAFILADLLDPASDGETAYWGESGSVEHMYHMLALEALSPRKTRFHLQYGPNGTQKT